MKVLTPSFALLITMKEFKDHDRSQRLRMLRALVASDAWVLFFQPHIKQQVATSLLGVSNAPPDKLLAAREVWKAWEAISKLVPDTIDTLELEDKREGLQQQSPPAG